MKRLLKYLSILLITLLVIFSFASCNYQISQKLKEIEQQYSQEFRQNLEQVDNKEYLSGILNDNETVKLLNNLFISQKKDWTGLLTSSEYEIEDLKLIIQTAEEFSGNDSYKEAYLSYLLDEDTDTNLSFLSLEEYSKLFKKFYNESYPIDNISSFINKLKQNKDYYDDVVGNYTKILIQFKLDEIFKEEEVSKGEKELRKKLEEVIQDPYFKTDTERLDYINEVSKLKEQGAKIEYLFNGTLDNYNPAKKLLLVSAFNGLEFSNVIIDALIERLNEAEDKIDADGDGFSNFSEITGLDENGDLLPFIDKDTGEKINYVNENGVEIEDGSSNPLDKYDTPEHMATINAILMGARIRSMDGRLTDWGNLSITSHYNLVKDNPHLEDLLIINSEDLGLDMAKGEFLIKPTYYKLLNKINEMPKADYCMVLLELPSDSPHTPYDNNFYYFKNTFSESKLLDLLKSIKTRCNEGFAQAITCNIGNLSTLPYSGLVIGYATESGIPLFASPSYEFPDIIRNEPFIDMGEAFNNSVQYAPDEKIEGDMYNMMSGLQHCAKKQEDGTIKYWNRNGVFRFSKDSNGNYIREETGEIIKIYDESAKLPGVPNFFMDYLFK